jgi:predicted DNA-binding transcriptional regulator AlpA
MTTDRTMREATTMPDSTLRTATDATLRTWVYIEELADETGIPLSTLRHWRQVGGGPASFRIGRRVAYDREAVRRWVKRQQADARH